MSWYHDDKMNDQIRIARHRLPSSDPVFNDSVSMGFTSLQGDGHFAFFVDIRRCYFCTQDVWNESVGDCTMGFAAMTLCHLSISRAIPGKASHIRWNALITSA
jgi:hypothetical protein